MIQTELSLMFSTICHSVNSYTSLKHRFLFTDITCLCLILFLFVQTLMIPVEATETSKPVLFANFSLRNKYVAIFIAQISAWIITMHFDLQPGDTSTLPHCAHIPLECPKITFRQGNYKSSSMQLCCLLLFVCVLPIAQFGHK